MGPPQGDLGPALWTGSSPSHPGLLSQGEVLLKKLQQLLDRNVSLAVATGAPAPAKNSTDLQVLETRGGWAPGAASASERASLGTGSRSQMCRFPRGRAQAGLWGLLRAAL